MHFKMIYTIVDGYLSREKDGPIIFSFPGDANAEVVIRAPTEDEKEIGHKHPCCEARYSKSPKPKIRTMFESLAKGRVPKGSDLENRPDYIDKDGNIEGNWAVQFDILPNPMKSFIEQVSQDLRNYIVDTFKLLRWRDNISGRHNPFASRGAYWSFDGLEWRNLPSQLMMYPSAPKGIAGSPKLCEEVISLYQNGVREPLAHELFREAYEQRHSNLRSSLILGVTAAEAATKNIIAKLQPETEWLLQNTPSPNLLKMLIEYVPKLPVRNSINGEVLAAPDTIIKPLKKAVQMRNTIVHGGECSLTTDSILEILGAVEDLLWLLDYYSGFCRAIDYLSNGTRVELYLS